MKPLEGKNKLSKKKVWYHLKERLTALGVKSIVDFQRLKKALNASEILALKKVIPGNFPLNVL